MRELTAADLRYVRGVVARGGALDFDDALGDAYEGAVVAARTHDPERGPWRTHLAMTVIRRLVEADRQRFGRRSGPSARSRQYASDDPEPHHSRPRLVTLNHSYDIPTPAADVDLERTATIEAVRAAVERLSPLEQEVAWASVNQGQRALAARLGVTESRISQRRRQVHARLRALLQEVA